MPKLIDVCCGTKSVSRYFAERGWATTTVDNDARWKPDVLTDVRVWTPPPAEVVWCSPPCTAFSRHSMGCWFPNEPPPDMSLVEACVRIIREANPAVWWIENVRGAVPFFRPILGEPACHRGSWYLWTNSLFLPEKMAPQKYTKSVGGGGHQHDRYPLPERLVRAVYNATVASLPEDLAG